MCVSLAICALEEWLKNFSHTPKSYVIIVCRERVIALEDEELVEEVVVEELIIQVTIIDTIVDIKSQ